MMRLFCQNEGSGPAIVILHGLMGSSDNWRSIRHVLALENRVCCLDLPNHGRSPHVAHFDLMSMAGDVMETLETEGIHQAILMGHSLGGKVAMQIASGFADRIAGLVVVDISPRAVQPVHLFVLRACAVGVSDRPLSSGQ